MTQALGFLLAFFSILLMIYLIAIIVLICRNKKQKNAEQISEQSYLLVYASQSGHAQAYAQQMAKQLNQFNESVVCLSIEALSKEQLVQAKKVFWFISTYGDGDAPDTAQAFTQALLKASFDLSHQSYAVLAFGDRRYDNFCEFGHALNQWLIQQGAQPYFDVVTVDQLSTDDLSHWSAQVAQITQHHIEINQPKKYWHSFKLSARTLLNKGSQGAPLYHIYLDFTADCRWQSGDILEIQCCNSPDELHAFISVHPEFAHLETQLKTKNLRKVDSWKMNQHSTEKVHMDDRVATNLMLIDDLPIREYSIASTMQQQQLQLIVRQEISNLDLGIGSGLLTEKLPLGEMVQAHIRHNPSFHLNQQHNPAIFIGNGSGLAGLMAHLHQRIALGYLDNWLIYGERQVQFDAIFAQQLQFWKADGALTALDLVYSRDQNELSYVQDVIQKQAEQLRSWVQQGASIYVCGSLKGMAQGVDQALVDILGQNVLNELRQAGRYKRDVY